MYLAEGLDCIYMASGICFVKYINPIAFKGSIMPQKQSPDKFRYLLMPLLWVTLLVCPVIFHIQIQLLQANSKVFLNISWLLFLMCATWIDCAKKQRRRSTDKNNGKQSFYCLFMSALTSSALWSCTTYVLHRRGPEGLTNQAYSHCFSFRFLWLWMGGPVFFIIIPPDWCRTN